MKREELGTELDQYTRETIKMLSSRVGSLNPNDEYEKIFLAGWFDAKGYISVAPGFGDMKGQYPLILRLQCSDHSILEIFSKYYGGLVHEDTSSSRAKSKKRSWYWACPMNRQWQMLVDFYPYLVTKAPQALIALTYLSYQVHQREQPLAIQAFREKEYFNIYLATKNYLTALRDGFKTYLKAREMLEKGTE